MSVAQLSPSTSTPPRRPAPSRPMLWRRISAPVSCVVGSRSASAAAACSRSTRSISTQPPPGLDQRAGLLGQPGHVGGRQLDVVEQHRPRRRCSAGGRRPPIPPASRRTAAATASPCVATASGPGRRSRRRRAPGRSRVMNSHASSWLERDLAAAARRRAVERRGEPSEARPLGGDRSAAALGAQRGVDGRRRPSATARAPTAATRRRCPGASSCTTSRGRDGDVTRARPRRQRSGHVAGERAPAPGTASRPCGRSTASLMSRAVRTVGRRRRELQALDALGGDRLDDRGDDRRRDRRAAAAVDRRHRRRHRRGERDDRRAVDERRAPAHGGVGRPALRPGRHAQRRHDRSGGGQAHALQRDAAEPEHAGADAVVRRGRRRRRRASRARPWPGSPARRPARRRAAGPAGWSSQPSGGPPIASRRARQLVVRLGRAHRGRRPHHDPAGDPRGLQLDLVRLERRRARSAIGRRGGGRAAAAAGGRPCRAGCRASRRGRRRPARARRRPACGPSRGRARRRPSTGRACAATPARPRGGAPRPRLRCDRPRSTRSPLQVLVSRPSHSVVVAVCTLGPMRGCRSTCRRRP